MIFPSPFVSEDVFQIGRMYMHRWFSSEIGLPTGVLSWVNNTTLLPYGRKLADFLNAAGLEAEFLVVGNRAIINGPNLGEPPANVTLPTCPEISIESLFTGLAAVLRKSAGTEEQVLFLIELLMSTAPDATQRALAKNRVLKDLMR